jgi:hypothetical protein
MPLWSPIKNRGASSKPKQTSLNALSGETKHNLEESSKNEASLIIFFLQALSEVEHNLNKTSSIMKLCYRVGKGLEGAVMRREKKKLARTIRNALSSSDCTDIHGLSAVWRR